MMKRLIFATLILSMAFLISCSETKPTPKPTLTTDVSALAFVSEGETKELKITSNVNWEITGIDGGITVTPDSGKGNQTVTVTMPINESYDLIITKNLTIKSKPEIESLTKTIVVTQSGAIEPLLTTDVNELTFASEGETKELKITSNVEWKITGMKNGITVDTESGKGNMTVSVTMLENVSYEEIAESLIIESKALPKTIAVTQSGMSKELIQVKTPGTLSDILEANLSLKTEPTLRITGTMNVADFETLKTATIGTLQFLDIADLDITALPTKAFENCIKLTTITLPAKLTSIADNVFYNCYALESTTIPDGVTSIGNLSFAGCSVLTTVIIPDGVTSIGEYAFASCLMLANTTLPTKLTSIGRFAFSSCTALTTVIIPDGMTSIGEYAFAGCTALTNITLPTKLTSIADSVFNGCEALKSITIPDGVTSIELYAFSGCKALKEVVCMAVTPPTLGVNVFLDIHADKKLKVPEASLDAYKNHVDWKDAFGVDNIVPQ